MSSNTERHTGGAVEPVMIVRCDEVELVLCNPTEHVLSRSGTRRRSPCPAAVVRKDRAVFCARHSRRYSMTMPTPHVSFSLALPLAWMPPRKGLAR